MWIKNDQSMKALSTVSAFEDLLTEAEKLYNKIPDDIQREIQGIARIRGL